MINVNKTRMTFPEHFLLPNEASDLTQLPGDGEGSTAGAAISGAGAGGAASGGQWAMAWHGDGEKRGWNYGETMENHHLSLVNHS